MFNTKITKKSGNGVRGSIQFEASDSRPLTKDEAMDEQQRLGYIPCGYGFERFKVTFDESQKVYITTWVCQASCD